MSNFTIKERKDYLKDFIKKAVNVSYGITDFTEDECKDMVSNLVTIGKIKEPEGEKLFNTLLSTIQSSRDSLNQKIDKSIKDAVEKIDFLSDDLVLELKTKLDDLENRINKLTTRNSETI